jgi:hypothetical protein
MYIKRSKLMKLHEVSESCNECAIRGDSHTVLSVIYYGIYSQVSNIIKFKLDGANANATIMFNFRYQSIQAASS